ncbi:unnamed protein product [Diamesa serratosioi]
MEPNLEAVFIYGPQVVKFTSPAPPPPLSKSEKKLKLKLEKEQLKKEQELQQIRDELNRELTNKQLSFARGWKDWERWCRDITHDHLITDVQVTTKALNRLIDKSDQAIETIKNHREIADEQYVRNFHQHCSLIDYIMNIYDLFLTSTHEMYDSSRNKLICDFYNENVFREEIFYERKTFYENVMHATNEETKMKIHDFEENLINRKVEIESASIEKRDDFVENAMKNQLIACGEIKKIVNFFNYKLWPKERMEEFQNKLQKTSQTDEDFRIIQSKAVKYENIIVKLKAKLNTITYHQLSVITNFKSEFNFMSKLHHRIEVKTKKEELMDKESIGILVTIADKVKKNLQVSFERGKLIQAASKVCKKYERMNDQIINDEIINDEDHIEDLMDNFRKKTANVEQQVIELRNLKQHLTERNTIMQKNLKEFDHNQKVQRNIWMLQISNAPLIGSASQISHHIPQIKNARKRIKKYVLNV